MAIPVAYQNRYKNLWFDLLDPRYVLKVMMKMKLFSIANVSIENRGQSVTGILDPVSMSSHHPVLCANCKSFGLIKTTRT